MMPTGSGTSSTTRTVEPASPLKPTEAIPYSRRTYKKRNPIERFFNKLKHFRRIATRYDRRAEYFLAALHLASAMIWMR